jgi:hypothetical protein
VRRPWIEAIFTIAPFLALRIAGKVNLAVCQIDFISIAKKTTELLSLYPIALILKLILQHFAIG